VNGRFLLDTNIIIALFLEEPRILERISTASEVLVSSISIGELYFGAYSSSKVQENLSLIEHFTGDITVLVCNLDTAKRYGDIKHILKEKGEPIPENDIWIAAIAQQYDLTLVTRDKHFDSIENLKIELW
jgi:tRNA(fMet)-specific endonuclease VapC